MLMSSVKSRIGCPRTTKKTWYEKESQSSASWSNFVRESPKMQVGVESSDGGPGHDLQVNEKFKSSVSIILFYTRLRTVL